MIGQYFLNWFRSKIKFYFITILSFLSLHHSETFAQGAINQAMQKNNGQWMERIDNPKIRIPVFSAECWVKAQSRIVIVSRDYPACPQSDWSMVYDYSRQRIEFMTQKNAQPDQYFWSSDNSLNAGVWNHVALVANGPGGIANIYINGTLSVTANFSSRNFDATTGLAWGGYYNGGASGSAYIDEARYWDIERSQSQIQNAKDCKLAPNDRQGLVGYWMFCGDFADSSCNGFDGVPRGNPQIVDALDLPSCLACIANPKIFALPLRFQTIICPSEAPRDSVVWIKNTGNADLIITLAQITGANASDFTLISPASVPPIISIKPNDSLAFVIRFNPTGIGNRSASLIIESNASNGSPYTIQLSGRKENTTLTYSPLSLNYGEFQPAQLPKLDSIRILNTGTSPMTITLQNFSPSNGFIILTNFPIVIPPGGTASVRIMFNGSQDGVYKSSLILRSLPCDSIMTVLVTASISRSIAFRKIKCIGEQPRDTAIVIHNFSDSSLIITRTTFSGTNASEFSLIVPIIPPTLVIPPNDSLAFIIRYDPNLAGSHIATLSIDYSNPNSGTLHIPVSGIKESFVLTLNKALVDFGQNQPIQLPKSDGVIIKNLGTTQVLISQNSFAIGTGFKILTPLPFNLLPGEEKIVQIKFDSTVNGVYQSILNLHSPLCDSIFSTPIIGNIISPITFNKIQCAKDDFRDTTITIHNFSDHILDFISAAFTGQDKKDFELIYPSLPPTFSILPQDSVTLNVRFKPLKNGSKSSVLNIDYSCIVDGTIQIFLFGQKESSTYTLDPSTLDFGVLQNKNLPAQKFILIHNTGLLPFTIKKIDLTPPDTFIVLTKLPLIVQPGDQDSIWIEFNPKEDGVYSARAIVDYSPCDDTTTITILGVKRHAPQIFASPLIFDPLQCFNDLQRDSIIVIHNIGTDTLKISDAQIIGTNSSDFTLQSPATIPPVLFIAPGDSLSLRVRFTPSANGDRSASLLLTTNSINSNSYFIQLSGKKENTQLLVNPTLLDFGNNQLSDLPRDQMITISNPGSIDRVITQASFSPQNVFTIVSTLPITIPAHGVQSILVRFSTNTNGNFASQLKITLTPCDTIIDIRVTGSCVNKPIIASNIPVFSALLCDNELYRDTIITIKNKGADDLIIKQAYIIGVDSTSFVLLTPITNQVTIRSGDSIDLRVRFSPIKIGNSDAILRIECNAYNNSVFDILLHARKEKILLTTSQKFIDLGILCPNEKKDSAFTIRNIGTIKTTASAESDSPINTTPTSIAIDTTQGEKIGFIFNGLQQEGLYNGLIRIRNQCGLIDTVKVLAFIAAPRITINPLTMSVNGLAPVEGDITIRNVGLRQVTFSKWLLNDSRFIIVSPQLPILIDTNSSMNVRIRYTPIDTSVVQTTFQVEGNPCLIREQSIVTVSNSTQRLISIDAVSHGTLRCEAYQDTSIIIRNIGSLPIQISKAQITGPNANEFMMLNPVTIPPAYIIPPNDQRPLQIRFQPQASGLRTAQLEFTSDATNSPFISLPLSGRKENMLLSFSDSSVDLGLLCPSEIKSKTIAINNSGTIVHRLSIAIQSPFTSNSSSLTIQPGLSDSVQIFFDGKVNEGFYSSPLIVTDECSIEHKILFTASVTAPKLNFSPASFSCLVDSFDIQDVQLHNPTSRSIQITSWDIPDSRFTVLSPILPQLIPSNADLYIRIKYTSSYPDSFATALNLHYLPCDIDSSIPMNAQSYEASAIVAFPILSASIDTSLSIPMNLMQSNFIQQSGATSYRTQMSFNRTLLLPVGVHTSSPTAIAYIISNITNDSNRVIDIEVNDTSSPTNGTILFLDCITGLGNAERTPLKINQFFWTNGKVKTSTIDGEFISTGICREGGARLLNIPLNIQLFQNYPNPFSIRDGSTILFSILNDPVSAEKLYHVTLNVFDIFGRLITTPLQNEFRAGEYKIKLNHPNLSEGIYIYQLRVDQHVITKFMTVIR